MRFPLLLIISSLIALSFSAATGLSQAGSHLALAISDETPQTFSQPAMQQLGITDARVVVPWNVTTSKRWLPVTTAWLAAAAAHGVTPLVSFQYGANKKAPTPAAYQSAFLAFHQAFPQVSTFSPWDEVNDALQPTFKHPALAAEYYNIIVAACPACTVVAGDLLDTPNMLPYLRAYRKALKTTPKVWGLHDYGDANYFRSTKTLAFLRAVPGTVWLTETGGIVNLGHLHFSLARAAKATSYVLHLAEVEPRITRIYLYNWFGTTTAKSSKRHPSDWDSGFVSVTGQLRPSYAAALSAAKALGQ